MTATATSTTSTTVADVERVGFTIAGLDLAARRAQSHDKEGNVRAGVFHHSFWATNPKTGSYGQQLPALAPSLPTSVTVDGVEFALEQGFTASEKKNPKTKVVTKVTPRPKATFDGQVSLPSFGDTKRQLKVIVSVRQDGTWNVIVMITDVPSPVSPEEKAARAEKKAETNLAAIKAALGLA